MFNAACQMLDSILNGAIQDGHYEEAELQPHRHSNTFH